MRKLFKERKLFKGGNYMRKYGIYPKYYKNSNESCTLIHSPYISIVIYRVTLVQDPVLA